MAMALIGGLITSTILTLVTLPALYGMSEGLYERVAQSWLQWRNRRAEGQSAAPATGD
jgi:hypothetical protein